MFNGLSKREYFAAMAMRSIISGDKNGVYSWEQFATAACEMADALINELNNEKP